LKKRKQIVKTMLERRNEEGGPVGDLLEENERGLGRW